MNKKKDYVIYPKTKPVFFIVEIETPTVLLTLNIGMN